MVKPAMVKITWHDAFSLTESWIALDSIDQEPCVTESIGFLLPNAKAGHVVLAQSINDAEMLDSLLAIPVAMVVATQLLS